MKRRLSTIAFILAFSTNAFAEPPPPTPNDTPAHATQATSASKEWVEINLGINTYIPFGYRNTNPKKKLQRIQIDAIPRSKVVWIKVDIKSTHINEVFTNLNRLGFKVRKKDNFVENRTLFITVDMDHSNRVMDLINELDRYETIKPDQILAEMKTKVREESAKIHSDVARSAHSSTSSSSSAAVSTSVSSGTSSSSRSVECKEHPLATGTQALASTIEQVKKFGSPR